MIGEEWDDDRPLEVWEYPAGDDADEESTTTVCPYCTAGTYDDTEQCPQCGEYITREQLSWSHYPPWVYAGALIGLIGIVASLFYIC
jgi:hypothetical protein